MKHLAFLILGILPAGSLFTAAAQTEPAPHTFTVSGAQFLLDGKPYQIISGDRHDFNISTAMTNSDKIMKLRDSFPEVQG